MRRIGFRHAPLLLCLIVLLWPQHSRADEVTQEIERARQAYLQGKFNEAKLSLELAAQLVAQQKAKLLMGILPPPFLGWNAEDKATTTDQGVGGAASMLGGITAARTYRKSETACTLTVAGDSPILAVVSMFLANPQLAQASGARLQRVGNHRAVITQDGEVQLLTTNNYLVTVTGDCAEADKIAYAGAVDYKRLAAF